MATHCLGVFPVTVQIENDVPVRVGSGGFGVVGLGNCPKAGREIVALKGFNDVCVRTCFVPLTLQCSHQMCVFLCRNNLFDELYNYPPVLLVDPSAENPCEQIVRIFGTIFFFHFFSPFFGDKRFSGVQRAGVGIVTNFQ